MPRLAPASALVLALLLLVPGGPVLAQDGEGDEEVDPARLEEIVEENRAIRQRLGEVADALRELIGARREERERLRRTEEMAREAAERVAELERRVERLEASAPDRLAERLLERLERETGGLEEVLGDPDEAMEELERRIGQLFGEGEDGEDATEAPPAEGSADRTGSGSPGSTPQEGTGSTDAGAPGTTETGETGESGPVEVPDRLEGPATLREALPVARNAVEDAGALLQISATNLTAEGRVDLEENGSLVLVFNTPDGARMVAFSGAVPEGMTSEFAGPADSLRPIDEDRLLDSPDLLSAVEGEESTLVVQFMPGLHENPVATVTGARLRMMDAYTGEAVDPASGR